MGPKEVRIAKVYIVEAGEYTAKHDPTPNWTENQAPVTAANAIELRVEAEAGAAIVTAVPAVKYDVYVQVVCLTNPDAPSTALHFGTFATPKVASEAFTGWEYQSAGDKYTKQWMFPFPTGALNPGPGPATEINQVYQVFVSLIDPAAGPKQVGCFAASEPFLLLG